MGEQLSPPSTPPIPPHPTHALVSRSPQAAWPHITEILGLCCLLVEAAKVGQCLAQKNDTLFSSSALADKRVTWDAGREASWHPVSHRPGHMVHPRPGGLAQLPRDLT